MAEKFTKKQREKIKDKFPSGSIQYNFINDSSNSKMHVAKTGENYPELYMQKISKGREVSYDILFSKNIKNADDFDKALSIFWNAFHSAKQESDNPKLTKDKYEKYVENFENGNDLINHLKASMIAEDELYERYDFYQQMNKQELEEWRDQLSKDLNNDEINQIETYWSSGNLHMQEIEDIITPHVSNSELATSNYQLWHNIWDLGYMMGYSFSGFKKEVVYDNFA